MQNINEILLVQHLYYIAATRLAIIGVHPARVESGCIGYFMTLENITEAVKSLDPENWYKGEIYDNKEISFNDLPEEDRWKIQEVMNDLTTRSASEHHLIQKCHACNRLSLKLGNKILDLLKEKNKLKKIPT